MALAVGAAFINRESILATPQRAAEVVTVGVAVSVSVTFAEYMSALA